MIQRSWRSVQPQKRTWAQVPPTSRYLVSTLEVVMITHAIFDRHRQLGAFVTVANAAE